MRITDGTEACRACGKTPSIIYCDGCEKPLCRSCRKFDLWQQGCGSFPPKSSAWPVAANPWVNPWGSAMDWMPGQGRLFVEDIKRKMTGKKT